jgi:hypothetical protein
MFSIFFWKEEGTEGKKLALALSCTLVVFAQNRNGISKRRERGTVWGRKWEFRRSMVTLISNRNRKKFGRV